MHETYALISIMQLSFSQLETLRRYYTERISTDNFLSIHKYCAFDKKPFEALALAFSPNTSLK